MMNWVRTPEGVRDLLYAECAERRQLENRMIELFNTRGYGEVATPGVEYYNLFARTGQPLPEESMYKLTDLEGRVLVLRPDLTMPIARVAATRLAAEPLPLRLCAVQSVYRLENAHRGTQSEQRQGGIELIGAGGPEADIEVISLAADCLRALGCDFRLELGHAGFFSALAGGLGVDDDMLLTLRRLIANKNFAALNDFLDDFKDSPAHAALSQITRLFGGPEVLQSAQALGCGGDALDHLDRLCAALDGVWFKDRVMLDLGMAWEIDYYSGVVFRAYTAEAGRPVLQGGRYDNLLGRLGRDVPACGFSLDIDALLR